MTEPTHVRSSELELLDNDVRHAGELHGPETMRRKTALAMAQASGIMIWTVVDDTTDDNSLLRAIHAAPEEAGG